MWNYKGTLIFFSFFFGIPSQTNWMQKKLQLSVNKIKAWLHWVNEPMSPTAAQTIITLKPISVKHCKLGVVVISWYCRTYFLNDALIWMCSTAVCSSPVEANWKDSKKVPRLTALTEKMCAEETVSLIVTRHYRLGTEQSMDLYKNATDPSARTLLPESMNPC